MPDSEANRNRRGRPCTIAQMTGELLSVSVGIVTASVGISVAVGTPAEGPCAAGEEGKSAAPAHNSAAARTIWMGETLTGEPAEQEWCRLCSGVNRRNSSFASCPRRTIDQIAEDNISHWGASAGVDANRRSGRPQAGASSLRGRVTA